MVRRNLICVDLTDEVVMRRGLYLVIPSYTPRLYTIWQSEGTVTLRVSYTRYPGSSPGSAIIPVAFTAKHKKSVIEKLIYYNA